VVGALAVPVVGAAIVGVSGVGVTGELAADKDPGG